MNVGNLFEMLSLGELSNLSISNEGSGTIPEKHQKKILLYANEGMMRIYSKFVLNEKDVTILLWDHITYYHLRKEFSKNFQAGENDVCARIRYILDLPHEPFEEDVIRILQVYDAQGNPMPLNNEEHPLSLFTPQANVLQVPRPEADTALSVHYQAKHPVLTQDLKQEIILPEVLQGALTSFVAYKVYSHMNTQESTAKSQEHYSLFTAICADVLENDLVNTSPSSTNIRFAANGWS